MMQLWPQRLLQEHQVSRRTSHLGTILKIAREMRDGVDRVVFLGVGEAMESAADLLVACREPYFNEWSRTSVAAARESTFYRRRSTTIWRRCRQAFSRTIERRTHSRPGGRSSGTALRAG